MKHPKRLPGLRTFKHWLSGMVLLAGALSAQAVAPTAPLSCTASSGTYSQTTPLSIPMGPAVVTSTIVVSGAGPYLWDVDVTTFIRHTFAADLDITITSPAGTVVTLTTDNGGSNDDVFNGTVWDDSAGDLVTDHVYANNTLASPLVPEEALSAFVGENPNGTWTITISDDLAGDGGTLDSWQLSLTTLPAAPITQTFSFAQNTAVPINDVATALSTLTASGAGASILDVNVTTFITHSFSADLDITLRSPAGTVVTLTTDNGASNDNVFNGTVWDDSANPGGQVPYTTNNGLATDHAYSNNVTATPLVPEGALGAFMGENPNGTWTLQATDDLAGDTGSIASWSMQVTTASCPVPVVLVAGADSGSVSTTTGGTAIADVRANDTAGGAPATAANTTLAAQGGWPAGITLTASGAVQVAAGTTPDVYVLTYRLSDIGNAATYVDTTATVTVTAAAAAPIPANAPWALLLCGLGLAGLAIRRLRA